MVAMRLGRHLYCGANNLKLPIPSSLIKLTAHPSLCFFFVYFQCLAALLLSPCSSPHEPVSNVCTSRSLQIKRVSHVPFPRKTRKWGGGHPVNRVSTVWLSHVVQLALARDIQNRWVCGVGGCDVSCSGCCVVCLVLHKQHQHSLQ